MKHYIEELKKQIQEIQNLKECKRNDAKFQNWQAKTTRIIKKLFGEVSQEFSDFSEIQFFYHYPGGTIEKILKSDFEKENFQNSLTRASLLLMDLIEEAKLETTTIEEYSEEVSKSPKKIFISHSSKDDQLGKEIINLLQLIGIHHDKIFFTSADGYGIQLGENWIDSLKQEIGSEVMVLSLITKNYFESQICLCELGAAWVLSKKHIPILVPPLSFGEVNEIISKNQGFEIINSVKWSSLKKTLEKDFALNSLPEDKWESQRDSILGRIKNILAT